MKENWDIQIAGKSYPCEVTYKRMKSLRFHFSRDGKTFLVSCPYGTERDYLAKDIARFLPKLEKKLHYEKPIEGDSVYLYGKKEEIFGFHALDEKSQALFLKKRFQSVLFARVLFFTSLMGIKTPYKITIRAMKSRYGVNNKTRQRLTFATSLIHYSIPLIDSVVVHELAHDSVADHSAAFYQVVERYCPDYWEKHDKLRKRLYE
jgi:predicted metal-dependent hydrolase